MVAERVGRPVRASPNPLPFPTNRVGRGAMAGGSESAMDDMIPLSVPTEDRGEVVLGTRGRENDGGGGVVDDITPRSPPTGDRGGDVRRNSDQPNVGAQFSPH